ncbi:phasin family protein [Bradyrhizobium sp.]|jgi:hypothetical protein|uniref:phasin family protein n=1 Tax=Bradyrhizobium sp. TaxID=376 RepID=UPI003BB0CA67
MIANAYGNYGRQSLDQTWSIFEKLGGVRSLGKAFELQTEFAKQAYEGFVAESQKIRELHRELARQIEDLGGPCSPDDQPALNPTRHT